MERSAASAAVSTSAVRARIVALARSASIEINVQDTPHLPASRSLLAAGTRIYVSHLPGQTWQQTSATCNAVREAGFDPIPHVPARLISDADVLDRLFGNFASIGVEEVLLIAGDYAKPLGPFADTVSIIDSGVLARHGVRRLAVAGHPEDHPNVSVENLRRAEQSKWRLANRHDLALTFLTQFFFEPAPFLEWSRQMRSANIRARLVGGIAGPAKLSTLLKFALRCGVGPSIRALAARPGSLLRLTSERGPEELVRELAQANDTAVFDGIHLFCFGGFLRTCEWLQAVARGEFGITQGGFEVTRGSQVFRE